MEGHDRMIERKSGKVVLLTLILECVTKSFVIRIIIIIMIIIIIISIVIIISSSRSSLCSNHYS